MPRPIRMVLTRDCDFVIAQKLDGFVLEPRDGDEKHKDRGEDEREPMVKLGLTAIVLIEGGCDAVGLVLVRRNGDSCGAAIDDGSTDGVDYRLLYHRFWLGLLLRRRRRAALTAAPCFPSSRQACRKPIDLCCLLVSSAQENMELNSVFVGGFGVFRTHPVVDRLAGESACFGDLLFGIDAFGQRPAELFENFAPFEWRGSVQVTFESRAGVESRHLRTLPVAARGALIAAADTGNIAGGSVVRAKGG